MLLSTVGASRVRDVVVLRNNVSNLILNRRVQLILLGIVDDPSIQHVVWILVGASGVDQFEG